MIIGIVNQKGGVGKTTLAVSLAYEAVTRGKRTLLVDCDPQQSVMEWSDKRGDLALPSNLSIISMAKRTMHRDIKSISEDYDFTVLDGPPRTTDITRSVILACDLVILPCTPSNYDVMASLETVKLIQEAFPFKEKLKSVFAISRKLVNTAIGRDVTEAIQDLGSDIRLLKSQICNRVAYAESSYGQSIQELNTDQKAISEMAQLYEELMEVMNG